MKSPLKIAMVSTLALATAAPAFAQYYQQPTDQYRQDQYRYQNDRADYDARQSAYDAQRYNYQASQSDYQAARADYERRLANWEAARRNYDARYGYGAYARRYGAAPTWDTGRYGAYSAGGYGVNSAYTTPRCNNNSTLAAGAIGAIAGALLGSNVAARNARTEGAVLGAVVGGGVGAAVGNANDKYKCDQRGAYVAYRDTIPYREAADARSDRYSYYTRQRCRLAPAPIDSDGRDYRYVRVCPDAQGRYRFTG